MRRFLLCVTLSPFPGPLCPRSETCVVRVHRAQFWSGMKPWGYNGISWIDLGGIIIRNISFSTWTAQWKMFLCAVLFDWTLHVVEVSIFFFYRDLIWFLFFATQAGLVLWTYPMVGLMLWSKWSWTNLQTMLDFPTPVSWCKEVAQKK